MVVITDVVTMKRTRGNSSTGEREEGGREGRYDNEEERMKGRERDTVSVFVNSLRR